MDPGTRASAREGARVTFHAALFPRSHRRPTKGSSTQKAPSLLAPPSRVPPSFLCHPSFFCSSRFPAARRPSLIVFTGVDSCLIAPERALCSLLGCETISTVLLLLLLLLSWASSVIPPYPLGARAFTARPEDSPGSVFKVSNELRMIHGSAWD